MSARIMGILNVTPDSFSDGNRWPDHASATERGREMFAEGADIVDVGGESTRPGASQVSVTEECSRILPVIADLAAIGPVSVDTRHGEVAEAAVEAGASIVNDISASLWPVAARMRVAWIAMHMQGNPATMQDNPTYGDVVGEVSDFLFQSAQQAIDAGVPEVLIDPGIGFGKTVAHNCALLANLDILTRSPYGVVVGASRKTFLGRLTEIEGNVPGPEDRLEASLAAAVLAVNAGASILRVHDVRATVRAVRVAEAVIGQARVGVLQ